MLSTLNDYRIPKPPATITYPHCPVCDCEMSVLKSMCEPCYKRHAATLFTTQPVNTRYQMPKHKSFNDHTPTITNYSKPRITPTQHECTITCSATHCTPTTKDSNYHYVTYTHSLGPVHYCPSCGRNHNTVSRPYDYLDTITTSHIHFNRKFASACLDELSRINSSRHKSQQHTIEDYLKMAGIKSKPPISHGITPLHVACKSCGGTFAIVRTIPTANTPPTYCIWCGHSPCVVTQYNTEETAAYVLNQFSDQSLQTLATQYHIPVALIEALYDEWQKSSHEPFFQTYMSSDEVKQVVGRLQR